MQEDYSIWKKPASKVEGNFLANQKLFGTRFGTNYLPNDFPAALTKTVVKENNSLLDKVAASSKLDAFQVWLGAVSAGIYDGDDEAVRKAGGFFQPTWVYRMWNDFSITRDQAEDVTNFNYTFTAYMQTMDFLRDVGIPEGMADVMTRAYLYYFSGQYQYLNDMKALRFWKVEHTFWGEEVKDVSRLASGLDYGQFIRMSNDARKFGVFLDERDFGFSNHDRETSVFGSDTSLREYEQFQLDNEQTLRRWEREREQQKDWFGQFDEDDDLQKPDALDLINL